MSEWRSIKVDGKPTSHCMCYVSNIRGGGECFLALYDSHRDIFTQYAPQQYFHPVLDVTHYIELPYSPREE